MSARRNCRTAALALAAVAGLSGGCGLKSELAQPEGAPSGYGVPGTYPAPESVVPEEAPETGSSRQAPAHSTTLTPGPDSRERTTYQSPGESISP